MEDDYSYIGKSIYFKTNKLFDVPYPISKILVKNNIIIVLKEMDELLPENETDSQNVYSYNLEGDLLWRITKLNLSEQNTAVYTGIYWENGQLALYNFCGVEVIVDYRTGEAISTELIK